MLVFKKQLIQSSAQNKYISGHPRFMAAFVLKTLDYYGSVVILGCEMMALWSHPISGLVVVIVWELKSIEKWTPKYLSFL